MRLIVLIFEWHLQESQSHSKKRPGGSQGKAGHSIAQKLTCFSPYGGPGPKIKCQVVIWLKMIAVETCKSTLSYSYSAIIPPASLWSGFWGNSKLWSRLVFSVYLTTPFLLTEKGNTSHDKYKTLCNSSHLAWYSIWISTSSHSL